MTYEDMVFAVELVDVLSSVNLSLGWLRTKRDQPWVRLWTRLKYFFPSKKKCLNAFERIHSEIIEERKISK
jgi:hypothetical protein